MGCYFQDWWWCCCSRKIKWKLIHEIDSMLRLWYDVQYTAKCWIVQLLTCFLWPGRQWTLNYFHVTWSTVQKYLIFIDPEFCFLKISFPISVDNKLSQWIVGLVAWGIPASSRFRRMMMPSLTRKTKLGFSSPGCDKLEEWYGNMDWSIQYDMLLFYR